MPSLYKLSQKEHLTPADAASVDVILASKTAEQLDMDLDGGYPVLIYATISGNIDLIKKLMEKGVDKNVQVNRASRMRTPDMRTALQIAGGTVYRRRHGGRSVVDDDVRIKVIFELGGMSDNSWREYAGRDFQGKFDDATAGEVAMPPGEKVEQGAQKMATAAMATAAMATAAPPAFKKKTKKKSSAASSKSSKSSDSSSSSDSGDDDGGAVKRKFKKMKGTIRRRLSSNRGTKHKKHKKKGHIVNSPRGRIPHRRGTRGRIPHRRGTHGRIPHRRRSRGRGTHGRIPHRR
uniref:Uncharacterized protein n=1 Tax=viral metagenome TaxID=1070528 RepID=A0A6C0BX66_9ZZZZ